MQLSERGRCPIENGTPPPLSDHTCEWYRCFSSAEILLFRETSKITKVFKRMMLIYKVATLKTTSKIP